MLKNEQDPFYVKCIEIPPTLRIAKTFFVNDLEGENVENPASVKCLIHFDSNEIATKLINTQLINDRPVLLQIYNNDAEKVGPEFRVTYAEIVPTNEPDFSHTQLTIEVSRQDISVLFPKADNTAFSIFDSKILISNN